MTALMAATGSIRTSGLRHANDCLIAARKYRLAARRHPSATNRRGMQEMLSQAARWRRWAQQAAR